MKARYRLALVAGALSLAGAGCTDAINSGPMRYVESEQLATELKDKPELQQAVRKALADLFGPDPTHIKVPEGAGLPNGGLGLANRRDLGEGKVAAVAYEQSPDGQPGPTTQAGGYALYRQHCLHCHGASGAGDGPTSAFLFPRPRDYRKGVYKFTSTPTGAKPARDDLRKTVRDGLHGTSMPSFEALMSPAEIEQVVDYTIFLGLRGETELALIGEAAASGELPEEIVTEMAQGVFNKWKGAESEVVNPPVPRTTPDRASVLRGRDFYLGRNTGGPKVDCVSCHGALGLGDGLSFVSQDVFNDVVFGGDPSTAPGRLARYDEKTRELWKSSLDEWGNPLRPANLNRGVYKGGRRPIDLYWRIAKGINGAKMPAHFPAVDAGKIWDLVNFALALPYEPALLTEAGPGAAPAAPPAVARN